MLNYARQRVIKALMVTRRAVLATSGPAGVQAGEFPCRSAGLDLYLLVPQTSDHLFNLEHDPGVTVLSASWELKGKARVVPQDESLPDLDIMREPSAQWCALVHVEPLQVQIHRQGGWGNIETIDLEPC